MKHKVSSSTTILKWITNAMRSFTREHSECAGSRRSQLITRHAVRTRRRRALCATARDGVRLTAETTYPPASRHVAKVQPHHSPLPPATAGFATRSNVANMQRSSRRDANASLAPYLATGINTNNTAVRPETWSRPHHVYEDAGSLVYEVPNQGSCRRSAAAGTR